MNASSIISNENEVDCWKLPEDLHRLVFDEFGESLESIKSMVIELRARLQGSEDVDIQEFDISDRSILRFLRGKKFRADKAYEIIVNNIKFRKQHSEWFTVSKEEVETFMKMIKVLSEVDAHLRRVIVVLPCKAVGSLTTEFIRTYKSSLTKFRVWLFDHLSYDPYAQLGGIVLAASFKNLTFWDTTRFSQLASIYEHTECVRYATKCSGFRLKSLMIFEEPFFFGFIWAAVSLILSEKIRSRFNICGNDYSKLDQNITHLEKIPSCLGGSGSDDLLEDNWIVQKYNECFGDDRNDN
jgi:hypothetical protein